MLNDQKVGTRRARRGWLALLSVAGLAISACGSAEDTESANDVSETAAEAEVDEAELDEADDHDEGYEFGEPADAASATRVIEIVGADDFTFSPDSVSIAAGEIVTFRVSNAGFLEHDFTLGDSHRQEAHEAEMAEMAEAETAMHDEANAFTVQSGETREMTWLITDPGELLFGCHTPGHYAAGMKGTITPAA